MRATLLQAPKVYKVNHISQTRAQRTDHKRIKRYHNFSIQMTKTDLMTSTKIKFNYEKCKYVFLLSNGDLASSDLQLFIESCV